jgi:tetratricopeptide (TPR) repeat protein
MSEEQNTNTTSPLPSASSAVNSTLPKGIPQWVFISWGIVTCLVAVLFILSFVLKPKTEIAVSQPPVTTHNDNAKSQTVWTENFDQSNLEGWTLDWANLAQSGDGNGLVLLAYHNMLPDTRSAVKFTMTTSPQRFFYARSPVIPVNLSRPYTITFDFHGKGPVELLDFGHIRLRLLNELPNLSYNPDATDSYRTFSVVDWTPEQIKQEKHTFKITVDPVKQVYETWIDGNSIGQVHYSENLKPQNQIYFRELPSNEEEHETNAVYYDNFSISGIPTQTISAKPTATPAPVSPEFTKILQAGWNKYYAHDFTGAIQSFQEATKNNPKSAEAYNALGIAYRASGDTTAALQAFVQSLSIDSTYEPARQNLGIQQ